MSALVQLPDAPDLAFRRGGSECLPGWIPFALVAPSVRQFDGAAMRGAPDAKARPSARLRSQSRPQAAEGAAVPDDPWRHIHQKFVEAGLSHDIAAAYADLVCTTFAGEQVYFPLRGRATCRVDRDRMICADRQGGQSLGELAKRYGLSRSQVRRISIERLDCAPER